MILNGRAKIGFLNEYLYLCMIVNVLILHKMRRITALIAFVTMLTLTGCGKFTQITVNSVDVEKVKPYGLRGLNVKLAVDIDNPAIQINLSDMEATVKYCGKVLGKVTVDPFTLEGRTADVYHLTAKMVLDAGVSLYDMFVLLDKNRIDNCVVDYKVKGKIKGGLSKTITEYDVPLKQIMDYAK